MNESKGQTKQMNQRDKQKGWAKWMNQKGESKHMSQKGKLIKWTKTMSQNMNKLCFQLQTHTTNKQKTKTNITNK